MSHLLLVGMHTCQSTRSSWQDCYNGVNGQHSCAHVRALTSVSQVRVVQCSRLFRQQLALQLTMAVVLPCACFFVAWLCMR
jgi:hypothetical protein